MASALSLAPCAIRPGAPGDAGLLINAWVESYYKHGCESPRSFSGIRPSSTDKRTYTAEQHAVAIRTLASTDVLVACNPEDEDQIVGFVVFEGPRTNTEYLDPRPVFHYVYTKALFRRMGIARMLIGAAHAMYREPTAWASHWHPFLATLFRPIAITHNEFMRR